MTPAILAGRVRLACEWEVRARKVGNVFPARPFADTTANDFLTSAKVAGDAFEAVLRGDTPTVGELVLAAVRATRRVVTSNTNLGMLLLLAPLALAAEPRYVAKVLFGLTIDDAAKVYEAIRLASPGGLGRADEQDVSATPTVTLREAMLLAANRDAIARQYQIGFLDVLEVGVPSLLAGRDKLGCVEAGIIHCQLELLARYPDTLIARKLGNNASADVLKRAVAVRDAGGLATTNGRESGRELDWYLRSNGNRLNPGATADLVAACIYCALAYDALSPDEPFAWTSHEWIA